ncbi:hypothetical protein GCK72_022573 [Caenorhabditis remanei]|uniref:C2H2-type domain-containing protein n=1 Tax=Caenorhabditis remanei TaxID=31234 RepID=A0A6A5FUR5_CAERE|nr:hypothetical protein GCK72_022573 [Caenorhabditis remanei]KAF1746121.1 hypothetical protein GCK72_022573 [Caenorhabditis remanei]
MNFNTFNVSVPRCFWITDCNKCNKIFDDGVKLGDHIEIYYQEQYQRDCSWKGCEKIFKTKLELKVHICSAHVNEMPFDCEICKCRFESPDDLKVHLITHEGEIFKCTVPGCKKKCKTLLESRQHMPVHQVEDDFVCVMSEIRFNIQQFCQFCSIGTRALQMIS